ncbi:reprolysin-like metallopeptidase [Chryseobacterium culicis]|uniref:Por secretion system C-terminal sorting domain-containing protein n=1 Tax=Chryseobacterium culicis TaxID=680127 RepID=A0A1H6IKL7_CHRCI|nr:M12 family metallo-peptidase [Chryseobacterium culicis]SEH49163.1 Por secretion system C-terminal sorting domain-containing protein [Chryseobacterium culicis]
MKKTVLSLFLVSGFLFSKAQRWEPTSQKISEIRKEVNVKYSYRFDLDSLRETLKNAVETGKGSRAVIVSFPTAEGKIEKFAVYSDPVVVKSLADKYHLGSYVGVGIDDPGKYIRFSTAPTEMQSMIIKDGKFQFIEPITNDKKVYGVFYKTERTAGEHGFECTTEEKNFRDIKSLEFNGRKNLSNIGITSRPASTKFRTYRLALATTGEYTKKFDPSGGTTNTVIQMNATMTRVNGIFQKDFAIKLIIQDLPNIIATDPSTDFYTPPAQQTDPSLNTQIQQFLTQQVGNTNYDIGHVFNAAGGNGSAGMIGSICVDPSTNKPLAKGSAFTQMTNPTGDSFDIDYVAHEMGHQLGANHTFSHQSEGSGVNVEPGGGSTIMGYAGITGDNIQMSTDAYFHYSSVNQVLNDLDSKPGCGLSQNITSNAAPLITPLTSYTIPKGTAYYLEAIATDTDAVNYTWEQIDSVDKFHTISGDSGWGYNSQGALARSNSGTVNGRRYFPNLQTVMSGNLTDKTKWETVSYTPRVLNYAVTVRDDNTTPMLVSAETTVTVADSGPFKFKGLSDSSTFYNNAVNTISWDVADTNNAPYNVSNVKIEYTTDLINGSSWTELVASTPNTGSYQAQMPSGVSGPVKFRISALGNIFYAISPKITIGAAPTSTANPPTGLSANFNDILKTSAIISWNNIPGATYSLRYRKVGEANWINTTSPVNYLSLNSLEDEANYEVQVASVVNTVIGLYSDIYNFKTKGLQTGSDYCLMSTGGNSFADDTPNSGLAKLNISNLAYSDATYKSIFRTYLDYTEDASKLINLTKGTQYTLSYTNVGNKIQDASYPDKIEVWIDYNRNGVFEDSEKIGSNSGTPNSNGLHTGNIIFTVPANAYSGDKHLRMRVASTSFVVSDGPCGYPKYTEGTDDYSYGSFKDFPVKILENNLSVNEVKESTSEVFIYPNPADTFIEVKNLSSKADYKIYSAEGRLVQNGKFDGQRINIASLTKGIYIITFVDDKNTYNRKLIKK